MQDPLEQITAGLAELAGRDQHDLPDAALMESFETLLAARHRLDGILVAQLQVIDVRDATAAEYGRHTRGWLVEDQLLAHEEASKLLTVAKALPLRPTVDAALLAGEINLDHARHIVASVKQVPVEIRDVFEKELVKAAESVDPTELGSFARELRRRLGADETREAAEQRRYDGRWVTLTKTFDGMHRLDGMLDPAGAAVVQTALAPLCRKTAEGDDRSVGQRRADALVTLADQALNAGALPEIGGEKPHLVCTLSWEQLRAEIDAEIDAGRVTLNGLEVSPATARMIACDAGIIPAVLGAHGEVLDLGRKTPAWSVAQRRALNLESPGCGWPGCQTGLEHCQAHHIHHRAHGGPTNLTNGINLCWYHHWLIHHSNWQINKQHGKIQVWRT
jgi:hypothetical protein